VNFLPITGLRVLSDATAAGSAMKNVVGPIINTLCVAAGLICAGFLVNAGIHYMTSSGRPDKLERAKKIMRDAPIGLVIVLSAATLTSILSHAYGSPASNPAEHLPTLIAIQPASTSLSLVDVLIKAITGLLQSVVDSIGKPFMNALAYFTSSTPLMAENTSVFKLWLALVAIADALFVLAVSLLGFHVMSASTLGLDELDFKHLLPQFGLIFLLINSSIFAIDAIISLSNGMIDALHAGFGNINTWSSLSDVAKQSGGMGLAALLIMVVFLVLAFILLVYYVGRLVTLYLGAVLAPVLLLLWLMPSFKDFATSAIKTYLSTIFVLFVHVVILLLAASILETLNSASPNKSPDPIMSLVVGMSTLVALIKTQGVMAQLNYASVGPKSLRKLSSQFMNGLSHSSLSYKSS
jgi:hypothetical protein